MLELNKEAKAQFLEAIDLFLNAYEERVKKKLFGMLMGPSEFLILSAIVHQDSGKAPVGGTAPGEEKANEEMIPLIESYQGIPVRVKMTPGLEPELDPAEAHRFLPPKEKPSEPDNDA